MVGVLKSYCNVNEVISGIMLNWIILYGTNTILTNVKELASPYTLLVKKYSPQSLLPSLGLGKLFSNNQYMTIAVPLSILIAVAVMIILNKTKFGYELKATGFNKNAAKYCGMKEKRNMILSLLISGALAGMGAAFFYLTGYEQWECTTSTVPGMGFNGIAATFLGGLNPIGTIFSSFFIQHITIGGANVDKTMYCSQISDLISALIIYLCGFVLFLKTLMKNIIRKREASGTQSSDRSPTSVLLQQPIWMPTMSESRPVQAQSGQTLSHWLTMPRSSQTSTTARSSSTMILQMQSRRLPL